MNQKKRADEPGPPPVLPPSGLAEEVLGRPLDADTPEVLESSAQSTGPEQLYNFADTLQRDASEEAGQKVAKDRMETWVTFVLDQEAFGLPVTHVQEILRVAAITRVPHAPGMVRGVTNMRGKVLPVVDLRVRLGMPPAEVGDPSRILVVSSRNRQMGLLVDSVQQVIRLDRAMVQPPPPDVMTAQSDYILGVLRQDDLLAILLDIERLLIIRD